MPEPNPARILRQHLQTDALLGVTTVPTPVAPSPKKPTASTSADAAGSRTPSRPSPRHPPNVAFSPDTTTRQPPLPQPPTAPPPPAHPADIKLHTNLSTVEKQQHLEQLAVELEQAPSVQALRPPNTKLVFGEGDPNAKLMFIGEGPGQEEDRIGRPFVGPAGQLLDKMITAMGLARESVYIANVAKYQPPGNRIPTPEEVAAQGPYLAKQVAIIAPTVLVALGGTATKYALSTTTGITRLRGQWAQFVHTDPMLPIMPTFHPAYLLRSYTQDNRKKVWADLQAVTKKL